MNTRRVTLTSLSLLLAFAVTSRAEVMPFDLEVGYRWLSLGGNSDMYRTQIDERSGLLVRTFTLTTDGDGSRVFDRLRIDASDLGVGPAGSLRVDLGKSELYRFRMNYRQSNAFSALPEFANPLLSQGIIPGQHTYDRQRKMFDADLELMPGSRIAPFLGFSTNRYTGPGTSTYQAGQDEFQLDTNLRDIDREFRIGSGFNFNWIYGEVTQGWRRVHSDETATLTPGAGAGNNPGPILDQPQTATSITRNDRNYTKTPFFNGYVTAQNKRLRVTGNYVRFAADASGSEDESVAGQFASFALSRYFAGLDEQALSTAKNHTWRGGGRAEFTLIDGLDLFAGAQREHRELEGEALLDTLYLQTITFGGIDPRDVRAVLDAQSSMRRDDDTVNFGVSAKSIGPMSMRGEYRVTKQEVSVDPDLEEIVVPGSQSGDYVRRMKTWDFNTTYSSFGVIAGAAIRVDNADAPILRTDFIHRDRVRLRASWTAPKDLVRIGVVDEETHLKNHLAGIGYDANLRQSTADLEATPLKQLSLRGSYSRFRADSDISYRLPQNFFTGDSVQVENGRAKEAGFTLSLAPATLDAGFARYDNQGSNPFKIDRAHVRVTYDFKARTGIAAEFDQNKYREAAPGWGDFDAKRYGVYLHFRP